MHTLRPPRAAYVLCIEAICEAVTRLTMRFVPVKAPGAASVMMLRRAHRVRGAYYRQSFGDAGKYGPQRPNNDVTIELVGASSLGSTSSVMAYLRSERNGRLSMALSPEAAGPAAGPPPCAQHAPIVSLMAKVGRRRTTMGISKYDPAAKGRPAWNADRQVGSKRALKPRQIWAIRFFLDREGRMRASR